MQEGKSSLEGNSLHCLVVQRSSEFGQQFPPPVQHVPPVDLLPVLPRDQRMITSIPAKSREDQANPCRSFSLHLPLCSSSSLVNSFDTLTRTMHGREPAGRGVLRQRMRPRSSATQHVTLGGDGRDRSRWSTLLWGIGQLVDAVWGDVECH